MAGTDLSGSSLWNVANVNDFTAAIKEIPSALEGVGSAFGSMAIKAKNSIQSIRDELAKLKGDLSGLNMPGQARSGNGGRWRSPLGGANPYASTFGSTVDAVAASTDRPGPGTGTNGGPGWGGGSYQAGFTGPYGGFSGSRLALGLGAYAVGKTAQLGDSLVQQGITQSQLNFYLQNASGGTRTAKWAMNLPNWAYASSTPQNLADLKQGLQMLGAAGYGPSTGRWASMAGQAGALASFAQNAGLDMSFSEAAKGVNFFNSNAGLAARRSAQVATTITNPFQAVDYMLRQINGGRPLSAAQIGDLGTTGTGFQNRLASLTGNNSALMQTLTQYAEAEARHPGASLSNTNNMTPQQINATLKRLGLGGTLTSGLEQANRNRAQATEDMANKAAAYYVDARKWMASAEKNLANLPGIKQILGFIATTGGLTAAVGSKGAIGAGIEGFGALRRGIKALKGERGIIKGASSLGGGATEGAALTESADLLAGGTALTGGVLAGAAVATVGGGAYAIYKMFQNDQNVNWKRNPNGSYSVAPTAKELQSANSMLNTPAFQKAVAQYAAGNGGTRGQGAGNGGTRGQGVQGQAGGNVGMPTSAPTVGGSGVVGIAEKYLGVPYVFGGTDPKRGLDCSGFTQLVYKQMGVNLPRTTYDQVKTGTAVAKLSDAQAGDLLFFDAGPSGPGHVGIYLGNNKMIDAPHTGSNVRIETVWNDSLVAIRRELAGNGNAGTSSMVGSVPVSSTATATGKVSVSGSGMLGDMGEGNAGQNESAIIASSMFATFAAPIMRTGTAANGGTQGNTSGNAGAPASVSNNAGTQNGPRLSGPIPTGQHLALIQQSLRLAGIPDNAANEAAVNTIVSHESAWNASAVNNWDSNAKAGHPSQGLMQEIPSTFKAYAIPGYNTNILDALSNLISGERYGVARYGSLTNIPGVKAVAAGRSYVGYEIGSQYIDRDQVAQLHRGEMVVRAADASTRRMLQNSSPSSPMIHVAKGAVTFNITPSVMGTSGSTSTPSQQDMESAAEVFWAHIEKKASLVRMASD